MKPPRPEAVRRAAPEGARPILDALVATAERRELALHLVGGPVRDLLLGLQPQDYDVATDATPDQICRLFRRTRKVGVQFGVVLVHRDRRWICL